MAFYILVFFKYRFLVIYLFIIICPIIRFLDVFYDTNFFHPYQFIYRADSILIGCLLAFKFVKYSLKLNSLVGKHKNLLIFSVISLFLFSLIFKQLVVGYNLFLDSIATSLFGSMGTISNLLIALIILISLNFREGIFYAFLNNKYIVKIGILSYSIYLWQQFFTSHESGVFSTFPLNLILILIFGYGSHYLIEKPFLKIRDKLLYK